MGAAFSISAGVIFTDGDMRCDRLRHLVVSDDVQLRRLGTRPSPLTESWATTGSVQILTGTAKRVPTKHRLNYGVLVRE